MSTILRRIIIAVAVAMFAPLLQVQAQRQLHAMQTGKRIDVTIGDRFFTSYHYGDDEKYPFFFPVNGPSGSSVTSLRNGIFPHHSSLFFGCDFVNGGNYWQEGLERGRIVSIGARIIQEGQDSVIIEDECIWKRPDAIAPIKDTRRYTITSPSEDLCLIDVRIDMQMLTDVTIGTTNHSLFSVRMAGDLTVNAGGTMVNAEGDRGEKETFGKPSPWMDFYGPRKAGTEGIAVIQHPSSRWYPSKWFTRDYGFMSPTPMQWPEDGKSTNLTKGETVTLRYLVVVHKGNSEEAGIGKLYEKFKTE